MLQALAEKFAQTLSTTVLASREHDGAITFTLTTGPKYTMTEAELIAALDASQGITTPATPAPNRRYGEAAGATKPAPPAVTEGESQEPGQAQPASDDKPKRKARTK
jgi:hypothetical protein